MEELSQNKIIITNKRSKRQNRLKQKYNIRKKIVTLTTVGLLILTGFVLASLPSKADFQSGSAMIYPSYDIAPCTNDSWTIIYTIGSGGNTSSHGIDGGAINVTIPYNWSLPQNDDPSMEGFVVVKTEYMSNIVIGEISITDRNISIPVFSSSMRGERIYIIYGEMSGGIGPGARAQCYPQYNVEFEVWENPDMNSDDWRKMDRSPKVHVTNETTGINGNTNITTTQAIGVYSVTFGPWPENDDSGFATISEDRWSYIIGLQLNNGDLYGDIGTGEEIEICLFNLAKTEMVVLLTTEFSITHPDPSDSPSDDIHIWYESNNRQDKIGQIDPWRYLINIPATEGPTIGKVSFNMWVDVGNTVQPGLYQFETFIEPTNWNGDQGDFETVNS